MSFENVPGSQSMVHLTLPRWMVKHLRGSARHSKKTAKSSYGADDAERIEEMLTHALGVHENEVLDPDSTASHPLGVNVVLHDNEIGELYSGSASVVPEQGSNKLDSFDELIEKAQRRALTSAQEDYDAALR